MPAFQTDFGISSEADKRRSRSDRLHEQAVKRLRMRGLKRRPNRLHEQAAKRLRMMR